MKEKYSFGIGVSLIWIAHLLLDFMLGVWPVYKTIIQLDLIVAGLIASLGIFIGEGLQLFFGFLSDKGHHQKLLTLGLGLTATIPFLSYVENEWLLFILVLFSFIGSGAFHPSAAGLVMNGGSPSHQSSLIALFSCGGMVGAASSQIVYKNIYHHFDGHTGFLALPIFLCAFICYFFRFPKIEISSSQKKNFRQLLQIIKPQRFQLVLLYIIQVFLQLIVLSFTFLLPDILKVKGYEEWFCLGGGYFCFILGSVLTSIPIGYCVGKVGYRLVLAIIVIASTCLLQIFLALETLSVIPPLILLFLLGGSMGVIIPVVVAGGTKFVRPDIRSFVSALYMGGATCLAGFGPILATLIASFFDEQAPIIALQLLSALFIVCLLLIYYLPHPFMIQKENPQQLKVTNSSPGAIL